jgi:hypothetical protein
VPVRSAWRHQRSRGARGPSGLCLGDSLGATGDADAHSPGSADAGCTRSAFAVVPRPPGEPVCVRRRLGPDGLTVPDSLPRATNGDSGRCRSRFCICTRCSRYPAGVATPTGANRTCRRPPVVLCTHRGHYERVIAARTGANRARRTPSGFGLHPPRSLTACDSGAGGCKRRPDTGMSAHVSAAWSCVWSARSCSNTATGCGSGPPTARRRNRALLTVRGLPGSARLSVNPTPPGYIGDELDLPQLVRGRQARCADLPLGESGAESLRANVEDRLPGASLGRVEGGDRILEGCDGADVRPQPSVPHPLDDLTQLATIGLGWDETRRMNLNDDVGARDAPGWASGPATCGLHPPASLPLADSSVCGCKPADGHPVCTRPRRYRSRIAASAGANQAVPSTRNRRCRQRSDRREQQLLAPSAA